MFIFHSIINIFVKGGLLVKKTYFGSLLASLTMCLINVAIIGVVWFVRRNRESV